MNSILFAASTLIITNLYAQGISKSNSGDTIRWKNFEIHNNKWGSYKLKKGFYHQNIFKNHDHVGWSWITPKKSYGVLGYPMIFLGTTAWNSIDDIVENNYYKNVNQIQKFEVYYNTKLVIDDRKYNLSFDFWLHNSPKVAFETIGAEIMIWEDYQKFKPFGKKIGTFATENGEYEVYAGNLYKKELKKGWKYIAFLRKDRRQHGSINILEFINYLREYNLIQNNIYLSSFEFGTEVLNSTGTIKILDYNININ